MRSDSMMLIAMLLMAGLAAAAETRAETGAHPALPEVAGFPSQPIRLIVYTSPGGLIDVTARRFARLAQEYADHPIAVINRPGGGGIVAFEEALREPADGHRLLAVTRSNISKMVATGREDLIDQLRWHSYIMDNPHVLITNSAEGPASWEELRAAGADDDQAQLWLGVDIGGVKHISGVKMAEATAIDMRWIPYGSGGEAVAALLGNLGTAYLGNPRDALASDRLRVVVAAAEERLPEFPEAPTFAELGYPGLEDELIWRGFAFRKGVAEDIQGWYSALIELVLADPRWQNAWANEAVNLRYRGTEDFTAIVERDREEFRRYLDYLGLLPDPDHEPRGLARLGQPPLIFGLLLAAGLGLLALAAFLPRTRWRPARGEIVLMSSVLLTAAIALLVSLEFPPRNPADPVGSAGLPRLWLGLLIPLAGWQIVLAARETADAIPSNLHTTRLLTVIALFAAYLLLLPVTGYLLTSMIYMPALIAYLGYRRWTVIAALTIGWLVFSELVFQQLLHVDLPRGPWFPW
ncbi:MAG: hypothetical protein EA419_06255 [Wenzhouxiangella sp.]|nr:MAG: hypothetical protein EA419_06255 [Wenzhouxiangella sp.]